MPSASAPRATDAETFLNLTFQRAVLSTMKPKRRLKVLKAWAAELGAETVVQMGTARAATPACVALARRTYREQLPYLLRE